MGEDKWPMILKNLQSKEEEKAKEILETECQGQERQYVT
jgi:hypothetical protein